MRTDRPARPQGRAPFTVAIAQRNASDATILTPAERREYDALRYDVRRRDWLAGRCAAKRAVARRRGVSVDRLRLETIAGAGPSCSLLTRGSWTPLPLALSIGHCAGIAIAAAGDATMSVGVDVEREDAVAAHERRLFLGTRERAMPRLDATLAWALKEAAWKALRLGLQVPFTALRLDFTNDGRLRGVCVDDEWRPARAFVVRLPHVLGMVAAVVTLEAA